MLFPHLTCSPYFGLFSFGDITLSSNWQKIIEAEIVSTRNIQSGQGTRLQYTFCHQLELSAPELKHLEGLFRKFCQYSGAAHTLCFSQDGSKIEFWHLLTLSNAHRIANVLVNWISKFWGPSRHRLAQRLIGVWIRGRRTPKNREQIRPQPLRGLRHPKRVSVSGFVAQLIEDVSRCSVDFCSTWVNVQNPMTLFWTASEFFFCMPSSLLSYFWPTF